jgi:hypothetical protein
MSEGRAFIQLRYAARCAKCGTDLAPKTEAHWDKEARKATCRSCVENGGPLIATDSGATPHSPDAHPTPAEPPPKKKPLDRGTAGASAAREWARRHEQREQQARDRYGRLSRIYLGLTNDPQATQAWAVGTNGERALGSLLSKLDDDSSVIVLHDRRIPRSRANIDHVAITRNGIHVIDAKNYTGKVQRVDRGGWFSSDLRLYVAGRNRTPLISAMEKQVDAIRAAMGQPLLEEFELRVRPALCFVAADWSLFAKPFEIGGVWVGWGNALADRIREDGPLAPEHVRAIAERVAAALPPA